ncbi:hypothetical protein EcWSU1_03408 [Enterobacter ludwigii]|uniref:Uncharacterized protein n=1 Tax=Enterobacter ludwigii TaxID=299767 RepID=G8LNV1_9ENTR|nr:hypothetical protein EcWSU1_03408 [Enterobacter ludwigii]
MLAFSIYIIALLATVICLTQKRAALTLKTLRIIAKPVLDFTEAVDKRLLIAMLQQGDRFTKPLVITFDKRQVVLRGHNNVGVKLRILSEQTPDHRQLQAIDRRRERQQLFKLHILFRQMQTVGKGRKVAQRLNERHVLIVLYRADPVQPGTPYLNLFQEPLIGLRLTTIAVHHNLLRQAATVRTKHRVQAKHRASMRRQHRLQGAIFDRCKVNQDAIFRQRWKLADDLLRHVDRHADDNHPRIGHQRWRVFPVLFFQNANLITRKRQHFFKQTPHLARTTHNNHRAQGRTEGFEALIVFAGIGFPHYATQDILNQIRRDAQRLGLFAPRSQHGCLTLRDVNRQAVFAFYLTHFGNQSHTARQQVQQRLIHFINLIA